MKTFMYLVRKTEINVYRDDEGFRLFLPLFAGFFVSLLPSSELSSLASSVVSFFRFFDALFFFISFFSNCLFALIACRDVSTSADVS